MTLKVFSVGFMIAILATAAVLTSIELSPEADALKSKGTKTSKYGSSTKNIVCGDRLCSEIGQTTSASDIQKAAPGPTVVRCSSSDVSIDNNCAKVNISGATVTGQTESDYNSDIISISSFDDGEITLSLSYLIINDIIMILVDGQEWDDVEINRNAITVMFPAGTEEIEFIGNQVFN